MIVFDLACPSAHVFEVWFGSSDDYESQRKRGLVSCPYCGSTEIAKAVMAPAVGAKGNRASSVPAALPMHGGKTMPPLPAELKAAITALAEAQAKALVNSEHVGSRFATEARAIHEGDAPDRLIHGQATRAEARELIEDGVPVAPLLCPVIPPKRLQ
jgi:hypothetical protein